MGEKRSAQNSSTSLRPPATPQQRPRPVQTPGYLRAKRKYGTASAAKKGSEAQVRSPSAKPSVGAFTARRALRLYQEIWTQYSEKKEADSHEEACKHVASLAAKRYKELHAAASELLLAASEASERGEHSSSGNSAYKILTFRGKAVEKGRGKWGLTARLQKHRKERRGGLREALCAVLACLCCRVQKSWLDAYDDEAPVRGYFAHALVDPVSIFRVAVRPGRPPRLASLIVTSELPLALALGKQDYGGPFPEVHAKEPIGSRQYGLQRIGVELGSGEERREPLKEVQEEQALRRLMASSERVLVLDVYCALGSKEKMRQFSLGGIIRQELIALLRGAKERGQAVLFVVGSEQPEQLAEKVYLQPWFTCIGGLRCGYLRWKARPGAYWEPPKLHYTKRVMFGLQLP